MNISELHNLLEQSPGERRRRKFRANKIASRGAQDVEHKMIKLRDRFQYQKSDVRFIKTTDEVPGTYYTPNKKGKVAKVEYVPDTRVHATTAIAYSQQVAHYFKHRSATHYFNQAINGNGFSRMNATAVLLQAARAETF